ncbi:glycosyltransferase family 4 protein [Mangrovimonas sp. TPBH4]|uniref:glycosyltransferase family 4 protein n=1 Tax=Mangrovimonas sp. TPBH4 TaxID=1645914 RepID=UPI0009E6CB71|nr:glycosyltransferase family 4 protein [Mangrovimonas sp. TPBH4]
MRILIVSNMYPSEQKAYAGIFVKNQFEELRKQFKEADTVDIFYMERKLTSKLGSLIKYVRAFFKFLPYLFKKFDVVHLHFFFPLIILVWIYKKMHPNTKVLVTFHGSDINNRVNYRNRLLYINLAKCIDFSIAVGNDLFLEVESKLNLKKGEVLSAGVDSKIFYKMAGVHKIFDYIFVGSFFEVKGIDILLKTIESLPKEISFCIVGKGLKYEGRIHELINQGYDITLEIDKSQEELRLLFNQSRFLVQPSREEGFGLVVAEAMFCGIPAIVSEVGGFKEQVLHGKNGFFFESEDSDELSRLLIDLKFISEEDYQNLSDYAQCDVKKLSLQAICEKIYTIYKNLVKSA